MFWGLHVKSTPKSSDPTECLLEAPVKITQAVLEPTNTKHIAKKKRTSNGTTTPTTPVSASPSDGPVSLMVEYENKKFILCTLDAGKIYQCPLDLFFPMGSLLKLSLRGHGTVHLSGYQLPDDDSDSDDMEEESDEAEDDNAIMSYEEFARLNKQKAKKVNGKPTRLAAVKRGSNEVDDDDDDDDDEDDHDFALDYTDEEGDDDDDDEGMTDEDDEMDDDDDDDDDDESDNE